MNVTLEKRKENVKSVMIGKEIPNKKEPVTGSFLLCSFVHGTKLHRGKIYSNYFCCLATSCIFIARTFNGSPNKVMNPSAS